MIVIFKNFSGLLEFFQCNETRVSENDYISFNYHNLNLL